MASEAQRLIGISLTKIAQSRSHRGGVSLHKNLLVATVLQKARYIFMEEAYNMARPVPAEELVGLTAEDAGLPDDVQEAAGDFQDFLQPSCVKCAENQNKENLPPSELTYLDLDKGPNVLKERGNCLKRRRAVAEWETEEAVQSILPKRSKGEEEESDSVFVDEATALADSVAKEVEAERGSAMEIDRITSLVSIFSFSMGDSKLNRSVSTPDLCSAQAKDADSLQQRPFLAMTV
ncbi:hypothetical protein TcasGA2_TC013386 [Tribolium castaneum]|uniref:Immediate early response gene 5-like protein n=1 Tax=Tribolium castaneum TaxID=7070 RepID=D6WLU4_TRICA|nr:hypothetical protein TcasGA2_TC013386 [Tribolium castaneum]